MENKTIYHSAFGGDLVFEPNDKYLEHAVSKERVAERYNSNRDPGKYGLKNTGRDKYSGLYKAADEAKDRQITREQLEARKTIEAKFNRFCDNLKTKINIRVNDNRSYDHKQITDAYKNASGYEVTINSKGDITIGDVVLVRRGEA